MCGLMLGTKASPVTYLHMEEHQFDLDILLITKIMRSLMHKLSHHVWSFISIARGERSRSFFFPGPSTVFTHHLWVGANFTQKAGTLGDQGFRVSLHIHWPVPSMIWSRQKQTQTYSNTLKQGESSISHAHTFNKLPVIYIHILICINTNSNTWFVTPLSFITSLSTGCRHATMGAVDDFDFASVATVIGRSANQGGSSFASSPLIGRFLRKSWD